jgi:hypothetical protein
METPNTHRSPLRDPPLRIAGESVHFRLLDTVLGQVLGWLAVATVLVLFAAMEWLRYFHPTSPSPKTFTVLAVCFVIVAAIHVRRVLRAAESLKMGRDGERIVAEMLQQLVAAGWRVFNDVPARDFNIDHVAIGHAGILAIETKTRSKPEEKNAMITVDDSGIAIAGHHVGWEPVDQAERQAAWLRQQLKASTGRSFDAQPIVLFPGWFIQDKRKRKQPWVLGCKELPKWVAREAQLLEAHEVAMASDHLDRYIRSAPR